MATHEPTPHGRAADAEAAAARDGQLVAQARAGDAGALSTLLARAQNRVYAVCLRLVNDPDLALDLAQDTLLKVARNLDQFDGRSAFATWTYRVATNVCLSHMRAARLRRHTTLDGLPEPVAENHGFAQTDAALDREAGELAGDPGVKEPGGGHALAAVERALATLDPEPRAILVLRDVRGLDYEQLAAVLDVPLGTVKSRLFRARALLRARLEAMGLTGDTRA